MQICEFYFFSTLMSRILFFFERLTRFKKNLKLASQRLYATAINLASRKLLIVSRLYLLNTKVLIHIKVFTFMCISEFVFARIDEKLLYLW